MQITPDIQCVRYEVAVREVKRGRLALGVADGRALADETCVYVAGDLRVGPEHVRNLMAAAEPVRWRA